MSIKKIKDRFLRQLWKIAMGFITLLGLVNSLKARERSMEEIMSLSYLGQPGLPRGMRNNNPGNLKITQIPWQGKISVEQNSDGTFEQFHRYVDGVRAMILDITGDIEKDGLDTITEMMYEYAPPSENPTETYIDWVADHSGIKPTTPLDPHDRNQMRKLIQAMAVFENRQPDGSFSSATEVLPDEIFNVAWQMTDPVA